MPSITCTHVAGHLASVYCPSHPMPRLCHAPPHCLHSHLPPKGPAVGSSPKSPACHQQHNTHLHHCHDPLAGGCLLVRLSRRFAPCVFLAPPPLLAALPLPAVDRRSGRAPGGVWQSGAKCPQPCGGWKTIIRMLRYQEASQTEGSMRTELRYLSKGSDWRAGMLCQSFAA